MVLGLVRRELELSLVNLRFVVETSICEYWYVYTTNVTCLKKTRVNKYGGGCTNGNSLLADAEACRACDLLRFAWTRRTAL